MSDDVGLDGMSFATLVDRTGGPSEFLYDGKRFTFSGKRPERTVPRYVAEWLFRGPERSRVWTTGGVFALRYGIKDGSEELIALLGDEPFDTDPITIDTTRVEGWDSESADPDRATATPINLKRPAGDFAHQGGAVTGTFSGKER